jgi:hypothetical protein
MIDLFLVEEEECPTGGTQIRVAIMSDLFVSYNKINIDWIVLLMIEFVA